MSKTTQSESVLQRCQQILRSVLRVSPQEQVLVASDSALINVGELFCKAATILNCSVTWIVFPTPPETNKEPPAPVALALTSCDVFILPTSRGMTHTRARRNASNVGARGVTLPGVTEAMLMRESVSADYASIASATEALAERLNGTSVIRVVSDSGTDLLLDVHGGTWFAERGLCDRPGDFGNLPGGEVSMAPVDAEGILVVDGSMSQLGRLKTPLTMRLRNREVTDITGDRAEELASFLESFGPEAFNVAEIGIGMNPHAKLSGVVLEDEKILGSIHIGFGDNSNMGGTTLGRIVAADVHIDGVVTSQPLLTADGVAVDPTAYFES